MGIETKFYDDLHNVADVGVTAASLTQGDPSELCLNAVGQGVGAQQRIGRKILMTGLHIRGKFDWTADETGAKASTAVRVLLVHDKQTNGAQIPGADVLTTHTNMTLALRNLLTSKRCNVLYDKTFKLQSPGTVVVASNEYWGQDEAHFSINKKLNIPVTFNGVGTAPACTIADIEDNSLHLYVVQAAGNTPKGLLQFQYNTRLRYVDA